MEALANGAQRIDIPHEPQFTENFSPPTDLEDLIVRLKDAFKTDLVNVELVEALMSGYRSNKADWGKFAKFDKYKYTRNLVDVGNGKYNLMLLCWGRGHGSSIHDHADSHCFLKVLDGEIRETLFDWPKSDGEPMIRQQTLDYTRNQVTYINDSIGLHRVENPSHLDGAVTLHLYCPPFDSCAIFDQKTGKKRKCNVTFWSKFGERTELEKPESAFVEDN